MTNRKGTKREKDLERKSKRVRHTEEQQKHIERHIDRKQADRKAKQPERQIYRQKSDIHT